MVIHRGEYICSELCAFVSRCGHSRCGPGSLFQALELPVFKQLKKTRVWSRNVANHIGSDYIVMKRTVLDQKRVLSVHLTKIKDTSFNCCQGFKFDSRESFRRTCNTDKCFGKENYWLQTISTPHLNMW